MLAAFTGYLYTEQDNYQRLISSFGLILSFDWSLANRGGKYWQENWEMVIDKIDKDMTGSVFRARETNEDSGCFWLKAKKFSVSKITIAISDVSALKTPHIINDIFKVFA